MNLAKGLHRLGRGTYAHPWRVIGIWVVILAIAGGLAVKFMVPASSAIAIPGTPAQQAIDRLGALFPGNGGATGRIVFHSLNGTKITDDQATIESLVTKVGKVDGVERAVSPFVDKSFVSDSGTVAYATIQLKEQTGSVSDATINGVADLVDGARSQSLQIEIGGGLIQQAPGEIVGAGEVIGVVIALAVLVMTLGSLIAGGMPILSAMVAVGVSMAGLFAMSRLFDVNSTTPVLAVMLGLAVGIDYALFIINKYRTLVLAGMDYPAAAARALGTAGNAVVFAAFTVIIALAALSIVNIPFMTTMGLVGAGSIAVSAIVALTLTPALLRLGGKRVFGRKARAREHAALGQAHTRTPRATFWHKWGAAIVAHPIPVLIGGVVVMAVIAIPAHALTLGLPSDQYAAKDSTQRKAYDLLTDGFGVGFNGPITVVVEGLPKVSDADREAVRAPAMAAYNKQVADATAAQKAQFEQAAAMATTPAQQLALQQQVAAAQAEGEKQQQAALAKIDATVEQYAKYVQLQKIADRIADLRDVKQTTPALVRDDGTAGAIQVTADSAPASKATIALISELRESGTIKTVTGNNGASLAVTGAVPLQEDINKKLSDALPLYLGVVMGLSFILLVIAFRSILVPVKATLGFLLSVLAMFGALVAVFQWGWFGITDAPGPIVSFIPIISIGVLFGLAMDYEFFLVSGMHEAHQETKDAKKAVVMGFGAGSKVVTAAAIIMISVFGGFIGNHEATIQSIGFGLALGILVDAFIVRMTIVPAVMSLLGKAAWWMPKWLDRIVPHVSIEGEEAPRK